MIIGDKDNQNPFEKGTLFLFGLNPLDPIDDSASERPL
jgi:hypothetical protein